MAKLPLEDHNVEGWDGPEYELNILCGAPGCIERSDDPHHIWRRSFLGGPFNWVILPDDSKVGNVVGLCRHHHDQVEAGGAWITWEDSRFCWTTLTQVTLPLAFQPPYTAPEHGKLIDRVDFENAPIKVTVTLENECPTCHQPFPKPKVERPKEEKRPRRTWSITVPIDQREDGAQNLDEKLEESRLLLAKIGLHYDPIAATRFTVLDTALSLFCLHFDSIVAEA